MNKQKIPPVKRNATTQQVVQNAMLRIGKDAETISGVKQSALNVFSGTIRSLERVNNELEETVERMDQMIAFAQGQKHDAEASIAENKAVIDKIREIIGE